MDFSRLTVAEVFGKKYQIGCCEKFGGRLRLFEKTRFVVLYNIWRDMVNHQPKLSHQGAQYLHP
jgi:hypothetical protein